jgi:replicative DNA helicase
MSIGNVYAERSILSAILKYPDAVFEFNIQPGDFQNAYSRNVFDILLHLHSQEMSFNKQNLLTFAKNIPTNELLDHGAFIQWVSGLFDLEANHKDIEGLVCTLQSEADKADTYSLVKNIEADLIEKEDVASNEILGKLEQGVLDIILKRQSNTLDAVQLGNNIEQVLEEKSKYLNTVKGVAGLPTWYCDFDTIMQGMMENCLYVVSARRKEGKSTFLLNVAKNVAMRQNSVLYLDSEMSTKKQQYRLLSMISEVPERLLWNKEYLKTQETRDAVKQGIEIMRDIKLFHKTVPSFSINTIRTFARKYAKLHDINLLIFDYIKMPNESSFGENKEYQAIGKFTDGLRQIGGEIGIPVLTAAQLNREMGVGMSDRIDHYCDARWQLVSKDDDMLTAEREAFNGEIMGNMILDIPVNRNGEAGTAFNFQFDRPILKFRESGIATENQMALWRKILKQRFERRKYGN